MMYNVSTLDSEDLDALKTLESETGRTLLAFSPLPVASDQVNDDELARIKALEDRLGVIVVAVRDAA